MHQLSPTGTLSAAFSKVCDSQSHTHTLDSNSVSSTELSSLAELRQALAKVDALPSACTLLQEAGKVQSPRRGTLPAGKQPPATAPPTLKPWPGLDRFDQWERQQDLEAQDKRAAERSQEVLQMARAQQQTRALADVLRETLAPAAPSPVTHQDETRPAQTPQTPALDPYIDAKVLADQFNVYYLEKSVEWDTFLYSKKSKRIASANRAGHGRYHLPNLRRDMEAQGYTLRESGNTITAVSERAKQGQQEQAKPRTASAGRPSPFPTLSDGF